MILHTTLLLLALSAPSSVIAISVSGDAQLKVDGQTSPLTRYMEIPQGAHVITGQSASVALRFASGSLIRVGENTEVALENLEQGAPAAKRKEKVRVVVGRIWARVMKLLGQTSSFEVVTKHAVAGVRGTAFWVTSTPNAGDAFTVDHGHIDVQHGKTKTVSLKGAGAFSRATQGGFVETRQLERQEMEEIRKQVGGAAASLDNEIRAGRSREAQRRRNRSNRVEEFGGADRFTDTGTERNRSDGVTRSPARTRRAEIPVRLQRP